MNKFEKFTDNFSNWLKERGIQINPKLKLEDLREQNQGRGLVAVEDIKEDQVLFSLPRSVTICVDNCTLIKDRPDLKEKLMKLNHWDSLIIVLLYEIKVVGEKSPWIDYFNILPINDEQNYVFNQLMFWSPEELKHLSPSLITERIGRDLAEAMYRKLHPKIVVHDFKIDQLGEVSLDEYHKIASLIMSYSFDVERPEFVGKFDQGQDSDLDDYEDDDDNDDNDDDDNTNDNPESNGKPARVVSTNANVSDTEENGLSNITLSSDKTDVGTFPSTDDEVEGNILNDGFFKSMVPLADMLNADTTKHNASLFYTKLELIMKSVKPIKKGQQVYNTYSDHPNSEILRRYGYVEIRGSKYDFGEIPLSLIKKFFIETQSMSPSLVDEVLSIMNQIVHDDEEDEMVDIVLDSYDCFKTGEVIIELIFVIQVLTIISALNLLKSMEHLKYESKFAFVNRILKKCYQLIESKKLTKIFLSNYKKILSSRIDQYPEIATISFNDNMMLNREKMAGVVLKSEYQSLVNCLNIDKAFNTDNGPYKFIEDDKLIKNIVKKNFLNDSPSADEDVLSLTSGEPSNKKQKTE